jgi:transcription elongation factor Elf1
MKITKAIEKKYLANPHFCPKCKSGNISAGTWDGEIQCQTVYCEDCSFIWREIFTMVSVEAKD